jgi:hypothetical protein
MGRRGKMGVHLDVPAKGFAGRLEVIQGPTGRRKRTRGRLEWPLWLITWPNEESAWGLGCVKTRWHDPKGC